MMLTKEQMNRLSDKHGAFEYGDAQGRVKEVFVKDVVRIQWKMQEAAPYMLEALELAYKALCEAEDTLRKNGLDNGSIELAILTVRDTIEMAEYYP